MPQRFRTVLLRKWCECPGAEVFPECEAILPAGRFLEDARVVAFCAE
jgi:hypothetical protein